jgi:hypothetical protein
MASVNAFLEAGNADRTVSVGGRSRSDSVWAWLNTDNASGSSAIRVEAEVCGQGLRSSDRRKKAIGDDRRSIFTVTLPERSPDVEVHIQAAGAWASPLLAMGAALGCLKAAGEAASGEPERAANTLQTIGEIMAGHEARLRDVPEVILPGGITLRRALAAVAAIEQLQANGGSSN